METPIAEKAVNAFVANAEMGFITKFVLKQCGHGMTETVVKGFKKAMGGLWVGGTATLLEKSIIFRPNALNRAVHAGDYSVEIPLGEITDIQVRFGIVTKIIDIVTDQGPLSIRCFGAEDFANRIRSQVKSAQ